MLTLSEAVKQIESLGESALANAMSAGASKDYWWGAKCSYDTALAVLSNVDLESHSAECECLGCRWSRVKRGVIPG